MAPTVGDGTGAGMTEGRRWTALCGPWPNLRRSSWHPRSWAGSSSAPEKAAAGYSWTRAATAAAGGATRATAATGRGYVATSLASGPPVHNGSWHSPFERGSNRRPAVCAGVPCTAPVSAGRRFRARDATLGYGEGEEVALALALGVALCSVGMVLCRVVAGCVLLWGRVGSLGAARCSVISTVL